MEVCWNRLELKMGKIALNYIYLSRSHAGGKDQVGLNLLRGLQDIHAANQYLVICYEYSLQTLQKLAPDAEYAVLPSHAQSSEFGRLLNLLLDNTFRIPKILTQHHCDVVYHLSCNNGLRKMPCISVEIPHDIKAISHRVLGSVKVPWYKYLLYRILYEMDFFLADYIIAISDTDKEEMCHYFTRYKDKVVRIYNPIITPNLSQHTQQKEAYVCALNLQFHHKNIITLIRAFELLKGRTDCKLILMGSVPERVKYLKTYVEEHCLGDMIEFTGFIPDDQVRMILRKSRLYVNPSLNEGFGMTAVEALMLKVPTLLSDIPTNREVTQNLCRYYKPLQDPSVLAGAIEDCLSNPPTEQELERRRLAMIKAYDYRVIANKYHEFFLHIQHGARQTK